MSVSELSFIQLPGFVPSCETLRCLLYAVIPVPEVSIARPAPKFRG